MSFFDIVFKRKRKSKSKKKGKGSSLLYLAEFPFKYIFQLNQENADKLITEQTIDFSNIPFGSSFEFVKQKKGKPHYSETKRIDNMAIRSVLYKTKVNSRKRIVIYYFIDNKFVLGEYVFRSPSYEDIFTYKKALIEKYLKEEPDHVKSFVLIDSNGIRLYFNENVDVWFKYLCAEKDLPFVKRAEEVSNGAEIDAKKNKDLFNQVMKSI